MGLVWFVIPKVLMEMKIVARRKKKELEMAVVEPASSQVNQSELVESNCSQDHTQQDISISTSN